MEFSHDELRLLTALSEGRTDNHIMTNQGWSQRSYRRRLKSAMEKLGAVSRFQAGFSFALTMARGDDEIETASRDRVER